MHTHPALRPRGPVTGAASPGAAGPGTGVDQRDADLAAGLALRLADLHPVRVPAHALIHDADAVIIALNHPSGDCRPSSAVTR